MKKTLFLILCILPLIFGCTKIPICGDGICDPGETYVCPQDCGSVACEDSDS
ncbi:hypothetical protein JXB31_00585 [Candidatus Woesearchaeota archaeon]|nr:hypothetical protein [Candidatus Woesearchaeota archaeon]